MDFSSALASVVLVLRHCLRLATSPYGTMRELSRKHDLLETAYIFVLVGIYYIWSAYIRFGPGHGIIPLGEATRSFVVFLVSFSLVVGITYVLGLLLSAMRKARQGEISTLIYLSSYALLPTFIWFMVTSVLYIFFPPPRYFTSLGIVFSFLFLAFSLSMFLWKLTLWYLTIRFALQARFITIVGIMLICGLILLPYIIMAYNLGLSRVPYL
ncbi:hypothetical protein A3I56_02780 [Candidatus Roizmanbacteria bacterium RIFCSPLOWO2_02_FULL_43_10]|uniref:Yip1 domain-containing protein n=1 Tax=Candidatus Roizmanbacteria bacterium RIFCSPLOWO2_02_FULL_43_10 TaxID=1802078 RepID=A0A1F7K1V9_9BACT|nr:MAG: hypothetical protein A3I56_02780 [Candidatus Roizmanbacteria bacterium RIFCSPLOWO2_02_FULL_43_10]